jgi:hypothetical protein
VLLPSATVFLLLLCNDKAVLGPWVNGRWTNVFGAAVVALLIMLSLILTVSVAFGHITAAQILAILAGGAGVALLAGACLLVRGRLRRRHDASTGSAAPAAARPAGQVDKAERERWRMPPLATLTVPPMSSARKLTMGGMWAYILIAMGVVVIRIVQLALGG